MLHRLKDCRRAATTVEYGLILAMIVLTMLTALVSVAERSTNMWNNVHDRVSNAS